MEDLNFRKGDAKTEVFGSNRMLQPSPVEKIPEGPTTPEIAYQMVKDETFAQTQPRLNLATFVTTYMDEYATKLMNEAININYIDETEYPRIAVMNGKCINIVANLWNSPEKETWKTGALAIGSSEACMLGGVAAWLRWRKKRQAQGKPFDKPNFVISTGFQVVWEKFAQLWQIEMREVPLTLDKTTLDPEEALKMCDENTICIVPIQGVTWTGLNDDVEALDQALDAYNAKTGYDIPIHVDAASGGFILPFLYPEKKWDFRLKWVLSISVSGHKFGGPKGIGFLYIRKGLKLRSFIHGGAQERKRRAGTENITGIVGIAKAVEIAFATMDERIKHETEVRDYAIKRILAEVPYCRLNGDAQKRVPNNINISFQFIEGESLLIMLDMAGICASSGSACTSGSLDPSHVLLAIGLPHEIAHGSLRMTIGEETTKEDMDYVVDNIKEIVTKLRTMSPLYEDFVKKNN